MKARSEFRLSSFMMNPPFLAVALAAGAMIWPVHHLGAFVYETATEFQADGDFDGDGRTDVVIVDKVTGGYRIGYQLALGTYTWAATRAGGVQNVSGATVGKLTATTRDALAFTAPAANRINVLDAANPNAAGTPIPVYIPSVGPNLVVALDIGGAGNNALHDLFVGSIYNNGVNPARHSTMRNTNGVNFGPLTDAGVASRMDRGNRVSLKTSTPDRVGVIYRGALDTFRAYDFTSGTAAQSLSQTLPAGSEYVVDRFSSTNPLSQFLFYRPGTTPLVDQQVLEPSAGTFGLAAGVTFSLGQAIQRVYVLAGTTPRLLVLYGAGETAEVFNFDGVNLPVSVQTFTAEAGEQFTGAGILGSSHFTLYSGEAGSGISSRFQTWNFNGANFTAGAAGTLPFQGGLSAAGNVLLFRYEPFVSSSPNLIRILNAGDWTSAFRYTGAPPVVTATAERYAGPTQGLRNPGVATLGTNPPPAAFGLVNQYTNVISVFSFQPPVGDEVSEVKIAPNPGHYNTAVQIILTPTDPAHQAYYRFASGAWQLYSGPVTLFSNVTVQYYAKPPAGNAKSIIRDALYTFDAPPSTLDSDNDGVPDFVELGKGLDPNGGSDSDGDGYSDLEELLKGTDPLLDSSAPTNSPRLEFKAVFDRAVTPRPLDGPANLITYAATSTALRVYAMQGSLLSAATVSNLVITGVTNPAGRLTNIVVEPEDRLLVESTELHYDILTGNADKRLGRELVGLLPAPRFTPVQVPYTFGGGALATEANAWIQAASNAWAGSTREISKGDLTIRDTLTAALAERKIGEILTARGMAWGSNITLFPFRPSDAGRSNASRALLLSLEKETTNGLPAYRLQTLYGAISNQVANSSAGSIVNLRAVAQEIYDTCSTYNNTNPARFVPPLDELRYFLSHCTYDSNYLAYSASAGIFGSACIGANSILAAVPPRPVTNIVVVATASVPGQPADGFQLNGSATKVLLFKNDGSRYDLPDSFGVVPGSLLQVRGYSDLTNPPASLSLEVITVSLTSIPVASDSDLDGNLLIDTWETLFFGAGENPFGDWDGDDYQNLQEQWEGSDPRDPLGMPAVPRVELGPPYVELIPDGAQLRLRFNWPAVYLSKIVFGVRSSPDLGTPFTDLPATGPSPVAGQADTFDLVVPLPPSESYFFYIYLALP